MSVSPQSSQDKLANILYIEDAMSDIMLTRAILDHENVYTNLFSIRDGVEALDFLHKKRSFEEVPTPDLVLLDLNIPFIHGIEILREIKKDDNLKDIAVVILSGSESPKDVEMTTALGALDYITKPIDKEKLDQIVQKAPYLHWEIKEDKNFLYSCCDKAA